MDLPYAEEINYWKTGTSSPDTWIERAIRQIQALDGIVLAEAFGKDVNGRSAYMLAFEISRERFKAVWPVLSSKSGNEKAARIQAATLLYHDVKARCLTSKILGTRAAFFSYLILEDGRTISQISNDEIINVFPLMFTEGKRE
jgi:hypothetical protein